MGLARLALNRSTGFSFYHGWLVSNYTGEIVRPWNLPHIIHMLREIRFFLSIPEDNSFLL